QGYGTYALINAMPSAGEAESWAGTGIVGKSLGSQVLALGSLRTFDGASADFSLELDPDQLPTSEDLLVGFVRYYGPYGPLGVNILEIQIAVDGTVVSDRAFDSLDAQQTLADYVVTIDPASLGAGPSTLTVKYLYDSPPQAFVLVSDLIVFTGHAF